MSIRFAALFLFVSVFVVSASSYAGPKDIIGYWMLEKTVGEPCSSQIIDLEYGFYKDGKYEINSKMDLGVAKKELNAKGTYKVSADMVTGYVEGSVVGPFRFKVEKNRLIIYQGSPNCEVHLIREE